MHNFCCVFVCFFYIFFLNEIEAKNNIKKTWEAINKIEGTRARRRKSNKTDDGYEKLYVVLHNWTYRFSRKKKFRSRRSIKSKNETPNNNSFKMKFAIDIDVFDTGWINFTLH